MLTGSIGMLPSASLGDDGPGCSSPCTARRPTSPGTGAANPLAMFLSAALMLRHGLAMEARGGGGRIGRRPGAGRGAAHARPGGRRDHRAGHPGSPQTPLRSALVEQADLIWHNGELVAWEDAKVHVLTHGLHYGTGVFEGERAYDTDRGPAIFRHHDHLAAAVQVGRALLHADPLHARGAALGHPRADRRQRAARVLHPPDRVPRLRPDGPVPARRAGRGVDRGVAVGRLPGRGGQARRRPGQGRRAGGGSPTTR